MASWTTRLCPTNLESNIVIAASNPLCIAIHHNISMIIYGLIAYLGIILLTIGYFITLKIGNRSEAVNTSLNEDIDDAADSNAIQYRT